ncbi:hypothetical protein [Maricaulis sp.]|uniref:hypothetical protein n=1 Tax=Maricaulis sp. TaxID=1486257 RepID=UPI0025BAA799|nr:hypothetical protein [Maricaulis sp.]
MRNFAWKSALFLICLLSGLLAFFFMLKAFLSGWREALSFVPSAISVMGMTATAIWLLALLLATVFKVADVFETRRVKALRREIGDQVEVRVRET